jgi:predicted nucleic acid-binding protein
MSSPNRPNRIFFDTNVFIIGYQIPESHEASLIKWASSDVLKPDTEIIVSPESIDEIRRVARRIGGKDWAGQILSRIWRHMNIRFVLINAAEADRLIRDRIIPREDIEIYLTAKSGEADYFISGNRELVRVLAQEEKAFQCLTPEEFIERHFR